MIAFVITGHAHFGSSMKESMEFIAGEQSNFYSMNFTGDMNPEDYNKEMQALLTRLSEKYDQVIVLTDLLGGTPFKTSATISAQNDKVHVISGTNLGCLLDAALSNNEKEDVKEIIERLLQNGKEQLFYFEM